MNKQITVLVVEDQEHIQRVLQYNLKLDGFEVYLTENGPDALELAQSKMPDVILLDWMMLVMDGLKVLSELKQDEATQHIPVFMLTAKGMTSDVDQALFHGSDEYITKPFDPTTLGKIIKERLKRYANYAGI